jgi:hypothetical protein
MSTFDFSVRRRDVAWAVALITLLSAVWVARGDLADAGGTPPGEGIARVYIAVGTNYPDALGVGPGGGLNGAPIIIVPTNPPIPGPTQAELVRLDPRSVVIVGGTGVVSLSMENALVLLLPNATITRISGADRYATNAEFSEQTFPVEGWVSVHPSAFNGTYPATDEVLHGAIVYNDSVGSNLMATVQLPHGSQILEFKVWVDDTNSGENVTVILDRQDPGFTCQIAAVTSSGDLGPQELTTTDIYQACDIVDNGAYTYFVYVAGSVSASPTLWGVAIRYRLGVGG